MQDTFDARTLNSVVFMAAAGFAILVLNTEVWQYGMPMIPEHSMLWSLARIPAFIIWLSFAAMVTLQRGVLFAGSFVNAFAVSLVVFAAGFTISTGFGAVILGPLAVHFSPVSQTAVYYAIGSGIFAASFRGPISSTLAGLGALVLQIALDVAVHVATGAIQLA